MLGMNMEKESHELKRPRKICKNQQSNLVEVELYLVTFSDSDFSGIQTIISSKEKMHLKHSSPETIHFETDQMYQSPDVLYVNWSLRCVKPEFTLQLHFH